MAAVSAKKGGTIYVNTQKILPMPVIMGKAKYPEHIMETLEEHAGAVKALDALSSIKSRS